jgi:hypothetical protein
MAELLWRGKMITKQGEALIAKYLLGQAPTYASYISFGCGAEPGQTPTGEEQCMKFEMLRVPISSRSFVNEDDFNRMSFAGELPLETQYKITEVALWSDSANALAASDSKVLFAFTQDENWKRNYTNQYLTIDYIGNPLSGESVANEKGDISSPISTPEYPNGWPDNGGDEVFACSAANQTLNVNIRRLQGARFLTRNIMMRGDTAQTLFIDGTNVNLSKNNPKDLLKFAFALYPKTVMTPPLSYSSAPPVTIKVDFMKDPTLDYAYTTFSGTVNNPSEFNVIEKELGELVNTNSFSWEQVRWVQISIELGGTEAENEQWYVCLDAMRFDNVTTQNPLYVMSGYSIVPLTDSYDNLGNIVGTEAKPITKRANTNSYAEFRFGIGTS